MKLNKFSYGVLLVCLQVVLPAAVYSQTSVLWGNLKPGEFGVGFRAVNIYDYSRSYINAEGRPIQIAIWYPAEKSKRSTQMLFKEYLDLYLVEESLAELTEQERKDNWTSWSKSYARYKVEPEKILDARAAAIKDAQVSKGRFPLIVYGAGSQGEAFENFILAEYLASHGFVVAASPSVGIYQHVMSSTADIRGAEGQARDMEFILAKMHDFPSVNWNKIGLVGWSRGALSSALVQMRNYQVKAVVSLDGSLPQHEATASLSTSYDISRMQVPYMFMVGNDEKSAALEYTKRIKYADTYYLNFPKLVHTDFSSIYAYLPATVTDEPSAEQQIKKSGYETICRYALNCFKANLLDDSQSRQFLQNSPEANGVNQIQLIYDTKKSLPAPPGQDEFFNIIRNDRIEKANEIYRKVKSIDPEYKIAREMDMVELAFELFNRRKRNADAIEVMKLAVEEFPDSYEAQGYLAEIYRKNESWTEALTHFSIAYGMALKKSKETDLKLAASLIGDIAWYRESIENMKTKLAGVIK